MSIAAQCVHGAGLCVLPKEANDFRPLALRHGPLAFISALLVAAKIAAIGIVALTPTAAELSTITTARIIQLTNAERTKAGLPPLAVNAALSQAAQEKGEHMLQEDYFAHISPSGVTPWFWIHQAGYTYTVAGENLAIDFTEAEDVVAAWIASPSHRENMLQTLYQETGVAVVTGEFQGATSTVVVHMFGLPAGQAGLPAGEVAPATTTPSPTSVPTPTATPVPTAVPEPLDTTPPRVPRIAVTGATTIAQESVDLLISGDSASRVHLLVNNQERSQLVLDQTGEATHTLALTSIADGAVIIRGYASDQADNRSALSSPLALTKDTAGPQFARENVSFVLSPATDQATLAATFTSAAPDIARIGITQQDTENSTEPGKPLLVPLLSASLAIRTYDPVGNASTQEEIVVQPQFAAPSDQTFLRPPMRFSSLARRITVSIAVAITILLLLAILIRIRIQRPTLIAHTSLVLILAVGLLLY